MLIILHAVIEGEHDEEEIYAQASMTKVEKLKKENQYPARACVIGNGEVRSQCILILWGGRSIVRSGGDCEHQRRAGNGTVNYSVAPTVGSRSGTLTVADAVISVRQEFNGCDKIETSVPVSFTLQNSQVSGFPLAVLLADFNHDGVDDAASVDSNSGTAASVALGIKPGGFDRPFTLFSSSRRISLVTADLNNNGNADLLTVGYDLQGTLTTFYGDGAGGFAAPVIITSVTDVSAVITGDFNRDGKTDLAFAAGFSAPVNGKLPIHRDVVFLPGNGSGFGTPKSFSVQTGSFGTFRQIGPGDFDNIPKKFNLVVAISLPTRSRLRRLLASGRVCFLKASCEGDLSENMAKTLFKTSASR